MASLRKYICTFQVTLAPAVLVGASWETSWARAPKRLDLGGFREGLKSVSFSSDGVTQEVHMYFSSDANTCIFDGKYLQYVHQNQPKI